MHLVQKDESLFAKVMEIIDKTLDYVTPFKMFFPQILLISRYLTLQAQSEDN